MQIKIDAKILDQNKHEMIGSDKPGFTASASFGTTAITSGSTNGLSLSENNTLTITSEALALLKSATGQTTITVTVSVTGTNVTATETITLTRAASKAAYLASGESGTETNLVSGKIFLNHDNMNLPGINAKDKSLCAAYPVYVMDQYDQPIQNDGKDVTVPAANFKLYPTTPATESETDSVKYDGDNKFYKKTGNEIDGKYAEFEDNSSGGVKLTITNGWDTDNNRLAVPDGHYIIEATYPNPDDVNQPLVARCVIKLTKAPVPTTATVTASTDTIWVPYDSEYASSQPANQPSEVTLTATVKDQYGEDFVGAVTLSEETASDKKHQLKDCYIWQAGTAGSAAPIGISGVTGESNKLTVTIGSNVAGLMKDANKNVVESTDQILALKVTAGTQTLNTTAKVKVSREASVLKKATVVMKQGETVVQTVNLDERPDNQKKVNIISPKANTTYTFTVTGEDQYGDAMATTCTLVDGKTQTGFTMKGQTLTVDANAEGEVVLDVVQSPAGMTYRVTLTFAKMQFVTSADGDTPYTIDEVLKEKSTTYSGKQWVTVLGAAQKPGANLANIYINGETEPISLNYINLLVKDASGKAVFDVKAAAGKPENDLSVNPKANAGTYTVSIVYTDPTTNEQYEVCHGSFKIEPKEVTIVLDPAVTDAKIEKEYDGSTDLPTSGLYLMPDGLVGPDANHIDSVSIDTSMLEFEKKDADTGIAIQLVEGKDCLKLNDGTQEGSPATNYTVKLDTNGNVEGLTGTITQKALDVYVEYYNKEWNGTKIIGGDAGRLADQSQVAKDDVVSVSSTRTTGLEFASSDAGSKLPATLPEGASITVTLEGASAGNYKVGTIIYNGGDTGATITKATFTLNASDLNKTYTYGETVNLNVAANLLKKSTGQSIDEATVNAIGNTSITLTLDKNSNSNGRYNVGTYTATVSVPTNQQNYTVDLKGTPTIKINPRGITIALKSGVEISKTYDGTNNKPSNITDASFDVTVAGGKVSGETVKLNVGELKYADANASENPIDISVGSNFWSIEGGDKSNYRFEGLNSLTGTITPKAITASMFSQKEPHPVYDGTERTLTGKDLVGTDSGITDANGNPKSLQPGTDFTAVNVTKINADTYQMTVSGKGNYQGTTTVDVKIDKFTVRGVAGEKLLLTGLTGTKATRGKTTTLYINTNVVLKQEELEKFTEEVRDHVGVLQWQPKNVPAGITVNVEPTGDFKLKVTVTVSNDIEMTDPAPQFTLELSAKFPDSANHQNIESTEYTNYEISVTDKEQQENFKIDQGESGTYSYSQGGVQLTTSGNEGDVTWSSSNTEFATVDNTGKVTFVKPGDVTITATSSETNYSASNPDATLYCEASDSYQLKITKGQVTITASSATMTANDPLPGFSATASGLNPNDSVSEVFQTLTATVSTDGKTAGTYRVTPNAVLKAGWDAYYDLSFVQGTLTVNPAASVIDTILPTIIAGNGCANGYANCACESFYDLDASRWYHEAIDWAYNLGLMNGTTKSTFGPNAAATRAQTWTMLARIAGQDTRRSSTWYEVGQKWAMNLGITDGTNPMGSLTREQLAAMLYRYVGSPAVNGTLTFTDSANVSAWARNAMIWAVQNGILDGVGGNRLNPKGTTTRAQAAAIFMRFSKLINK